MPAGCLMFAGAASGICCTANWQNLILSQLVCSCMEMPCLSESCSKEHGASPSSPCLPHHQPADTRILTGQLYGEVVGLVMAPIIFYYLYYQVCKTSWELATCQDIVSLVC